MTGSSLPLLEVILAFVDRTVQRGVPMRVALARAEKRYGVPRRVLREFLRQGQE